MGGLVRLLSRISAVQEYAFPNFELAGLTETPIEGVHVTFLSAT